MKEPLNLSIESDVIKAFKANCERVGISVSTVVEIFMAGMLSDEPLERMERFVNLTKGMRKTFR